MNTKLNDFANLLAEMAEDSNSNSNINISVSNPNTVRIRFAPKLTHNAPEE